jgi:hypothetical protein
MISYIFVGNRRHFTFAGGVIRHSWRKSKRKKRQETPMPKKKTTKEITIRSSAAEYLAFAAATGDNPQSIEMRYQDERQLEKIRGRIIKSDVVIAKNYLTEGELESLGRIANAYLYLSGTPFHAPDSIESVMKLRVLCFSASLPNPPPDDGSAEYPC